MRVKTVKSEVALIPKHSTDKRNKPSAPEPKTSLAEHPALSRSDSRPASPFLHKPFRVWGWEEPMRSPRKAAEGGPPSPAQASARPASGPCEDPRLPAGLTLASAPEASPRGMPVPSRPHARHLRPFLGWVSQPAARAPSASPPAQGLSRGGVPAARQLHRRSWGSGSRLLPPHGRRPCPGAAACRAAHPRSRPLSPAGPHGSVRVPSPSPPRRLSSRRGLLSLRPFTFAGPRPPLRGAAAEPSASHGSRSAGGEITGPEPPEGPDSARGGVCVGGAGGRDPLLGFLEKLASDLPHPGEHKAPWFGLVRQGRPRREGWQAAWTLHPTPHARLLVDRPWISAGLPVQIAGGTGLSSGQRVGSVLTRNSVTVYPKHTSIHTWGEHLK